MKEFDFYQVIGVVAPGAVLISCLMLLFAPDQAQVMISVSSISIGGLGLGLILAYVAGQLLQAIGNVYEHMWWRPWGGLPTDWLRGTGQSILGGAQLAQVESHVKTMLGHQTVQLTKTTKEDWRSIVDQMRSIVLAAGLGKRMELFNANYGLCRGLAAAFLVVLVAALASGRLTWNLVALCALPLALATYRMHRFGKRYAVELFIQYLCARSNPGTEGRSQ